MGLGRKLRSGFMQAMGVAATAFLVLSLIFPHDAQIKVFYYLVSLEIPSYLFTFFTFELKLFSKHLWVRRIVAVTFSLLYATAVSFLFGYLRWERKYVIVFGIAMTVAILIDIFSFYVADTIQKRNLEAINQKLAEQNKNE